MYSVVQVNGDGTIAMRNPWGVNPNSPNDGGYITISGDTALLNMSIFCTATLPQANPTPNPDPNPNPNPDPNPNPNPDPNPGPTPNDVSLFDEALGVNSFVLDNGAYADAFTCQAAQDGTVQVSASTTTFVPQLEVLQFNADGSTQVIAVDSNPAAGQQASVQFAAQAGSFYEIIVVTNDPNSYGAYQLALSNSLSNLQQLSPG
jgi:hypothetical protein